MLHWVVRFCCALTLCGVALPDALAVSVYEWSGNNGWLATEDGRITIYDGGTYKFYATVGGPSEALASIPNVVIDTGVNSPVQVHIIRDPIYGGGPGCVNLGQMDLTNGEPGVLGECQVENDLAAVNFVGVEGIVGPVKVGGNVAFGLGVDGNCNGEVAVTGATTAFQVIGELSNSTGFVGRVQSFDVGVCRADVTFGSGVTNLTVGTLAADSTMTSNGSITTLATSALNGAVDISGSLGYAYFGPPNGLAGRLGVDETITGEVLFQGGAPFSGALSCDVLSGPLHAEYPTLSVFSGTLKVNGQMAGTLTLPPTSTLDLDIGALTGMIRAPYGGAVADGDWSIGAMHQGVFAGSIRLGLLDNPTAQYRGTLSIGSMLGGAIAIHGALNNGGNVRVLGPFGLDEVERDVGIEITAPFPSNDEFVTVDWNGDVIGTSWGPWGVVTVNGFPYAGNSPSAHVWDITDCKGDMDNDGDVDFFDIDPLVAAFGDGASYDAKYPGLAGSRIFHGDLNGDHAVNFFDIDPFIARLGTCSPAYSDGGGQEGGGDNLMLMGDPATLAAQLGAAISAERLPDLIAAIEQLALNPPAGSTVNWSAVLAALAGI